MYGPAMLKFLLLLLLCSESIVAANNNFFEYQQFDVRDKEAPVYVEEMDTIKVYRQTWKIFGRIDISAFDEEFEHVKNMVGKLQKLCNSMNSKDYIETLYQLSSQCEINAMQLEQIMNETEINWTKFVMPTIESESRMNISEIDRYLAEFDRNHKKEGLVSNTIDDKEYATFIELGTYFMKNKKKLTNETKCIDTNIDQIMKLFKQLVSDTELKGARLKDLLQDLYSYVSVLVLDFQIRQKSFSDELTFGKVLAIDTLEHSLKELQDVIKKNNLELPFELDHEFKSRFYDVTSVQSMITNKQFVVVYTMPIVERLSFKLYHLTAYPRKLEGQLFELMLPDLEYVAVNRNKNSYIIMTEKELKQCYHSNSLICELTTAIISTEKTESCGVNLLLRPEVSSYCNYRMMDMSTELWLPLKEKNSWLFVFAKPQQVTITCNNFVDIFYMDGEGVLSMKPMCSAKTDFVEIIASRTSSNQKYKHLTLIKTEMGINWKAFVDTITRTNITSFLIPKVIDEKQLDILEQISIGVDEVKLHQKLLKGEAELHDKLEKMGEIINIGMNNNTTVGKKDLFEFEEIEIVNYVLIAIVLLGAVFRIIYYLKFYCGPVMNKDFERNEYV